MGIAKKTLITIASIFFIITIVLFLYSRFFFLNEYLKLEKEDASLKVEQSLNILDNKISSIKMTAVDYAAWDETYNFVSEYNHNYVDSTFTNEFFENLKINFFALFDNNGKMVFISQYDFKNHKLIVNNDTLEKALLNNEKLINYNKEKLENSGVQGLVKLTGIPTLIISTPVLKSDNSGPAKGTLIIGQYLDENTNNLISNALGFPVKLYNISDTNTAKEFNDIIQKFNLDKKTEIKYETGQKIQAYSIINDIDEKPLLLIQISLPRDTYNEGLKNIELFLIIIVLTGILSCLALLFLLRKIVLARLINLSKETIKIGQTKDLSKNINCRGNDELSELANNINKMLENLRVNEHEIKKSEKRFKDLVEFLPEIVIEVNKEQKIVFANKSFFDVTEYTQKDFNNGLYIKDIIIPNDTKKANIKIAKVLNGGKTTTSEYTAIKKDGTIYPILVSSTPIIDEQNSGLNGFRSIIIDISDRKKEEELLRESEERWQFALEGSGDGIWDWNIQTKKIFFSKRFKNILGYEDNEVNDNPEEINRRIHPNDYEDFTEQLNKHLNGETPYYTSEFRIMRKDGTYIWAIERGKVVSWTEDGKPLRMIGTFSDITLRKGLEVEIRKLAYRDPLTNLPNRLLFNDRLELTIADSERNAKKFALIVIDIDRFKDINDTYGHNIGDELLLFVGKKIEESLRKSDTIARFGGDEFLLLIPAINSKDDTITVAEKILNTFKNKFILSGYKLNVTISMGIAIYPHDGKDSNTLFKNADSAMYQVKEQGRNNYKIYSADRFFIK